MHHLLISGLLKDAEDTIPITSLGARTFCSAVSAQNDEYELIRSHRAHCFQPTIMHSYLNSKGPSK